MLNEIGAANFSKDFFNLKTLNFDLHPAKAHFYHFNGWYITIMYIYKESDLILKTVKEKNNVSFQNYLHMLFLSKFNKHHIKNFKNFKKLYF